ncbi:hypothetical protein [Desulfobacula sp.]|uniref:hypothetical protein n=1 Tax=Desulfobacula sp. TaxID=2593537 RepID=UPI002610E35F|nr:hypothetical protein [Desulfobacula sp.]
MPYTQILFPRTQAISLFSLVPTLAIIFAINHSLAILFILLILWFFLFRPFDRTEILMFIIGSLFIVGQNYSVLKSGGFSFTHKDFLLMPYYEPFMWGFYYLHIKRFINEPSESKKLEIKAILGLLITGACFSIFAQNSNLLTIFSFLTTAVLLTMFHERYDLYYAGYALVLGFIIEVFGVFSGNWWYPDPDMLGIPYWFITMWISVGLLARRFLIPFTEWLSKKIV